MAWTQKDLENLKGKVASVNDQFSKPLELKKYAVKLQKISIPKQTIDLFLRQLAQSGHIKSFERELKFDAVRKFRFDWAVPTLMVAIEYEGIFSEMSGHTSISGFTSDVTKYNLATVQGWKILRYTAVNYRECYQDLIIIINREKMSTKSTDAFKAQIENYLQEEAAKDELFAVTLKKENKNITECIAYILSTVQKSGVNGFADDDIYGMAKHYYDEDELKPGKAFSGSVVVNHKIEISEQDHVDAKKKAMDQLVEEEKAKLKSKPKAKKESAAADVQSSLF